jgi:anti-sigma B factor antagonist
MLAEVALEDHDGVSVAHVRGEVDLSNAKELRGTLQDVVQHVSAGLVLDFSETDYLDSAGLHFVFELGKRLRDRGQRLELVVPRGSPVESVLQIVNVESLAPMSPSLDVAVARLRGDDVSRT